MKKGAGVSIANTYMGIADQVTMERGHIRMIDGRMPENDNEIAMELTALANMGLGTNVGQDIVLSYFDSKGQKTEKSYRLSGVLVDYTGTWANGLSLPGILVTEKEYEAIGVTSGVIYMYYLRDDIKIKNEASLVDQLSRATGEQLTYNSFIGESTVWGSKTAYYQVAAVLVVVAVCALIYTYFSYTQNRKREYYRLRCFGISRGQLRHMIVLEGIYAMMPWMAAGLATGFLLSLGLGAILMNVFSTEYLFPMHFQTILICVGCMFIAALTAITLVTCLVREKRLYENVARIPVKKLHRIRNMHMNSKNMFRSFHWREVRLNPMRSVAASILAISVMTCTLLCIYQVYQYYHSFYRWAMESTDYSGGVDEEHYEIRYGDKNEKGECMSSIGTEYHRFDLGIPDSFFTELASVEGVQDVERFSYDSWMPVTWEGIENSPIREFQLKQYENHLPDWEDEHLYVYGTYFHEDAAAFYEQFQKDIPAEYYDPEAFARGEQVLYVSNNAYEVHNDYDERNRGIIEESTLKPGDYVTYETENGPVQVMVAAMLYEKYDSHMGKSTRGGYEFEASVDFGQKLASKEGKDFSYVWVRFNVDNALSFAGMNQRITNLFSNYNLTYSSRIEKKVQEQSKMLQMFFVFGTVVVIHGSVFLVVYANMIAGAMRNKKKNIALMNQLGISKNRLIAAELRECMLRNLWMVLAVPIAFIMKLYDIYLRMSTTTDSGHYDELTRQWVRDSVTTRVLKSFQGLTPVLWIVFAIIIMYLAMLLVSILPVIREIRDSGGVFNGKSKAGKREEDKSL